MTVDAREWDADACERGVRQLFTVAEDLDRAYRRLGVAGTALADWRGAAATVARPRMRLATLRVSGLAGLLRQAADAVRSGLGGVADAARLAVAQSPQEAAESIALAVSVDRRMASGLAAVDSVPGPVRLPDPDRTPADVARWWTALPPHLRRRLIEQQPAALGRLAGLPADVRDEANRRQLTTLLRQLRAERDRIFAVVPPVPLVLARTAVLRSMLAVAESVERALAARPRARLFTLDLDGAGRVAIGLGDVDQARHVAVLVPGMGADALHGVGGTVDRAEHVLAEAGRQSAESTAVVAWVGYAAPSWRQVPFATRARAGGRLLTADLQALDAGRSADGGGPAHVTLVGHSYGSTVIGAATRSGPRRADDLVLLGSPGVLADDVGELGLSGRRVYVGEAPFDPVADLGAFGADPGDPGFGATPVRADPEPGLPLPVRLTEAHSHYFDPGSESLRNVARVVVGHDTVVTHPGQAA
ncbi:MAG TPA: alpha/beta hydrolase [Mycobacteriales bacterium]